ncbi:MAG: TlpA disulfide reductase family protein [Burkholderiales bacterium]|nr:TlpA disulfide reductase family protein [Burkholderiales bacterium]
MSPQALLNRFRPRPVTLILLGLVVYLWFRPPAWVDALDQPAPDVPIGEGRRLADWRGRVVLVNFWATWCPYCRHEMPAMQSYYQDHRHCGFDILALSLDDDPQVVARYMREQGYTFPATLALPGVAAAFGGVDRLPTSFVIDRAGRIRHKVSGQVHYARLERLVSPLLGSCPRPAAAR